MLLATGVSRQGKGGLQRRWAANAPALLLVKLVAHTLGQLAELALRLGVVGVDHQVLQVPEAPAEVLEPLTLLEEASNLGADLVRGETREAGRKERTRMAIYLPSLGQRICISQVAARDERFVPLRPDGVMKKAG